MHVSKDSMWRGIYCSFAKKKNGTKRCLGPRNRMVCRVGDSAGSVRVSYKRDAANALSYPPKGPRSFHLGKRHSHDHTEATNFISAPQTRNVCKYKRKHCAVHGQFWAIARSSGKAGQFSLVRRYGLDGTTPSISAPASRALAKMYSISNVFRFFFFPIPLLSVDFPRSSSSDPSFR
jgi:hypothetical protein